MTCSSVRPSVVLMATWARIIRPEPRATMIVSGSAGRVFPRGLFLSVAAASTGCCDALLFGIRLTRLRRAHLPRVGGAGAKDPQCADVPT